MHTHNLFWGYKEIFVKKGTWTFLRDETSRGTFKMRPANVLQMYLLCTKETYYRLAGALLNLFYSWLPCCDVKHNIVLLLSSFFESYTIQRQGISELYTNYICTARCKNLGCATPQVYLTPRSVVIIITELTQVVIIPTSLNITYLRCVANQYFTSK